MQFTTSPLGDLPTKGTRLRKELYSCDMNVVEKYEHRSLGNGYDMTFGGYNPEDRCFYCGENLSGEAVLFWAGHAPTPHPQNEPGTWMDLFLHPGCFIELTTRLFRDLHAVQCVMDYRVIQNASPRPEYPPKEERSKERWAIWNRLRNSMRDLSLVRQ